MATLTICLIGTSHDKSEEYNLLVVTHALVDATDIPTTGTKLVPGWTVSPDADFKVIFDGAPAYPFFRAASHMTAVTKSAVEVVKAFGSSSLEINVVGHSRGAITAVMIANAIRRPCNLILVDPVRRAPIPDSDSLRLGPDVSECLQFVMEDEHSDWSPPRASGPLFKLAAVALKDESGTKLTTRRLPGTHGTATQCNPFAPVGKKLPGVSVDRLPTTDLWPIGALALKAILHQLADWQTKLLVPPKWFDEEAQLHTYQRILLENRHQAVRRTLSIGGPRKQVRLKRVVNDVLGKREETQKTKLVEGYRSESMYSALSIPQNRFRGSPLFVNEHHFALFEDLMKGPGSEEATRPRRSAIAAIKNTQLNFTRELLEILPVTATEDDRGNLLKGLKEIARNMPMSWSSAVMTNLEFDGQKQFLLPSFES